MYRAYIAQVCTPDGREKGSGGWGGERRAVEGGVGGEGSVLMYRAYIAQVCRPDGVCVLWMVMW